MPDQIKLEDCERRNDLGSLADMSVSAADGAKIPVESAILRVIGRLEALNPESEDFYERFFGPMDSLFDRAPLGDPILCKAIEALGRKGFLNYLEAVAGREDLGPLSGGMLASVAAGNGRFHILETLLERGFPAGPHLVRAVEDMMRIEQAGDWEEIEKRGDLWTHQKSICAIMSRPGRLGLDDGALARLLSNLNQSGAFRDAELFGLPDMYDLGELYLRLPPGEDRDAVERLFLRSSRLSEGRFEDIRSDSARAESLPYDDGRKAGLLRDQRLSDPMKERCRHFLRLMDMYTPYRKDPGPPRRLNDPHGADAKKATV